MTELSRRELPVTAGFSAPHLQCYAGAQCLYELLEQRTATVYQRAAAFGGGEEALVHAAAEDALERQALSEAVQVFCAITVESAVNLLGVLLLGEEQFLREVEGDPIVKKLQRFAFLIRGEELADSDDLMVTTRRLANARNSYVHPKPQEGRWRQSAGERRADIESARAAIADVRAVFSRLRKLDRRYSAFFILF